DLLGVAVADRCAERLDHLRDFGVPDLPVHERRVADDVIETVARDAIGLDLVASGARFQLDALFGRRDDRRGNRQQHGNPDLHRIPHVTVKATRWTTLW